MSAHLKVMIGRLPAPSHPGYQQELSACLFFSIPGTGQLPAVSLAGGNHQLAQSRPTLATKVTLTPSAAESLSYSTSSEVCSSEFCPPAFRALPAQSLHCRGMGVTAAETVVTGDISQFVLKDGTLLCCTQSQGWL